MGMNYDKLILLHILKNGNKLTVQHAKTQT